MTLSELRRRIGYIPQQGRLFSGTVESNLKFAGDMVSDDDMRQAARISQAEDFIAEREGGYDSPISQGGSNVSGGQRQRIAIARALIVEPQILVLDEPTSALDVTIQKQVLQLLQRLQRERGLSYLLITHDIDVIRAMAHQVLVMRNGEIVESGSLNQITQQPKNDYTALLVQ